MEQWRHAVLACSMSIIIAVVPATASSEQQPIATGGHLVEPATTPSHRAVLKEVAPDLWRFLSLDTAVVLGIGSATATLASVWDKDVDAAIRTNAAFNNALEPGSKFGAFAYMLAGSYGVYLAGRAADRPHIAVVGADLFRSQITTQLWVQGIKFTARRVRPDGSNDVSFPSGHSAAGFAVAAVLTRHYGWKAAVPSVLGAAYIGAARIHDNKHYLSDVTFGAAMGFAGARTVMLSHGRYNVHLEPAIGPGGWVARATITER